ncbi:MULTISPECIES: YesL family protein [unclassified Romboutsia]|uniref:YesL family protein n=1 Tax=unclassified Romboutsia TaxID=2626894 RepID=UPI0008207795|nr:MULTISPECIES: YesL family protein [unclassified Romboutsia]SCI52733.1 Predicted integral membrane protein [uncultured Clostridium sp.]
MINLFRYDNKFFEALEKVTNIITLNFLCILFSIPIITIGASITSTYYVAMKIVRNEEGYIFKMFIKSFKENFKVSTVVWISIMVIGLILILDFRISNMISNSVISNVFKFILMVASTITIFNFTYIFPIISKFENSIKNTIINAVFMSVQNLPYTIIMVLLNLIPIISILFFRNYLGYIVFFYLVIGYAVVSCINSLLLNNIFNKYIN